MWDSGLNPGPEKRHSLENSKYFYKVYRVVQRCINAISLVLMIIVPWLWKMLPLGDAKGRVYGSSLYYCFHFFQSLKLFVSNLKKPKKQNRVGAGEVGETGWGWTSASLPLQFEDCPFHSATQDQRRQEAPPGERITAALGQRPLEAERAPAGTETGGESWKRAGVWQRQKNTPSLSLQCGATRGGRFSGLTAPLTAASLRAAPGSGGPGLAGGGRGGRRRWRPGAPQTIPASSSWSFSRTNAGRKRRGSRAPQVLGRGGAQPTKATGLARQGGWLRSSGVVHSCSLNVPIWLGGGSVLCKAWWRIQRPLLGCSLARGSSSFIFVSALSHCKHAWHHWIGLWAPLI